MQEYILKKSQCVQMHFSNLAFTSHEKHLVNRFCDVAGCRGVAVQFLGWPGSFAYRPKKGSLMENQVDFTINIT